jgi:hypothetical protein
LSFSRGLHRSPPEKVAHRLGAHLLGLGAVPKGAASLTPCQRMDQGQSSTCHAHSAAGAVWTACNAKGRPMTFVPSPREIASTTYADVRAAATPPGQPLPPLQDQGADLQDDATAMAKWGVCPMGATVGRFSDVPDDNGYGFPEPVVSELQIAGQDLIGGEYQIPVDDSAPTTVALCLDAGIPIWLGTFVGSAFENLGATGIAQPPDESDPKGGGHAMYISGYRTAADGSFEFRVENSWGSGWADGGAVWASSAWLKACWSLWPMAVCP